MCLCDFDLLALSALLGHTLAGAPGFDGVDPTQVATNLNGGLGSFGFGSDDMDDTRPYAYLNYVLFRDDYTVVDAGWRRVPPEAGFDPGEEGWPGLHQRLAFNDPVVPGENGYLYVWVSNESENTKVWFDDLKVTHTATFVAQATDYGAWGDVLREQRTDERKYRYGYQGQFAERDEETGWNHFEAREYNPITGTWTTVDPVKNAFSPYLGMDNIPIVYVDPDGRCPKCPQPGSAAFEQMQDGDSYIFSDGFEYILVDKSLGVDGWVRLGGDLTEITIGPSEAFSAKLAGFGASVLSPFIDVGSTLWVSARNGYAQYFQRSKYNEWYSYKIDQDGVYRNLDQNGYNANDGSQGRATELITNTVSVNITVFSFGVNFPISENVFRNWVANTAIKQPTKLMVVSSTEKALSVHK